MKNLLAALLIFNSLLSIAQSDREILENLIGNGCFKASFQKLNNEGIALINITQDSYSTLSLNSDKSRVSTQISDVMTALFDEGIKVMSYDVKIEVTDVSKILLDIKNKYTTGARYFFLIDKDKGVLYDRNDNSMVGYFKCLMTVTGGKEKIGMKDVDKVRRIKCAYIAEKVKASIIN
tara:strand:- start:1292 stop:1825 length:534 start_codon:yes stop_codon:yes gene_type:complete